MVESYINGVNEFSECDCSLELLNAPAKVKTGKSIIDNLAYIFTQRKAVCKYLKQHSYDVVHIHTSREFLFLKDILLAKMIKQKFHIPVVMTIHVGAMETVFNRIGWFKNRALSIMNKYIDKSIFLSKVMQEEFISCGLQRDNATVLYNFHNLVTTDIPEKIEPKTLQLLFVGMLNKDKGIIELLTALTQMPELDYHLNICGKLVDKSIETELEDLKAKLGDKVSFLGYVVGEDKTKLFHNSDMLILPSYHEGLPIVIMEALAAGCAIMSTRVGAIPEVLFDENCYWIDIASTKSIKETLQSLQKENLVKQQNANFELGKEYSFEGHIKKLSNIYESVLNV